MSTTAKPEFQLSRTLSAPRDLVFRVWTQPEHLAHWWGPKGVSVEVAKLDLRPGGVFHYGMKSPNGNMWGLWVFKEVIAPEKLVFVNSFADEAGNIVRAPFSEDCPLEMLSTVTFTEADGLTTLTLHATPLNSTPAEDAFFESIKPSMEQGWGGTFEALDAYLEGIQ